MRVGANQVWGVWLDFLTKKQFHRRLSLAFATIACADTGFLLLICRGHGRVGSDESRRTAADFLL